MKKSIKQDVFIKQPIYEGGAKAMQSFIYQNLKYPNDAIDSKIEGVVELRITIDREGKVTDVYVLGSISPAFDKEAIRVAKLLKFTIPKNPRKLKVLFHRIVKIQFKVPKPEVKNVVKTSPQKMVYNYTSIASPQQEGKIANKKPVVYQYSIKT